MSDKVSEDTLITKEVTTTTTTNVEDRTSVPLEPIDEPCTCPPEEAHKTGKKRLREVSIEAQTPKDEHPSPPTEVKEIQAPPKKNRLRSVEPTVTEESLPLSTTPPPIGSPPLSTSPPYDSKVRQIRRRVKDLSWQEAQRKKSDEAAGEVDQQDDGPEAVVGEVGSDGKLEDDESYKSGSAKSESDKDEVGRVSGEEEHSSNEERSTQALHPHEGQAAESFHAPVTESEVDAHASTQPDEDKFPGPSTSRLSPDPETCQGKRRREDGDQNPREAKRVTPPPEPEVAKPSSAKPMGFLAYAASASPFATKDSTNIFGQTATDHTYSNNTVLKPPAAQPLSASAFGAKTQAPYNLASTTVKFGASGFNAYASAASPFAQTTASGALPFAASSPTTSKTSSRVSRSKSPGRHANAFGPYTARSGKFTAAPVRPAKKLKRGSSVTGPDVGDLGTASGSTSGSGDEVGDEEPERSTNFGDILRAKEDKPDVDEERQVEYREQEVMTGEEDERTEYQVRARLFAMEPPPQAGWKERGFGTLKLNVNKRTGRDARLVLRTDGTLRVILNASLFKGMNFETAQDPRYVKFGIIQDKRIVLHTLRLSSVKHAEDLLDQVKAHTPGLAASYKEV